MALVLALIVVAMLAGVRSLQTATEDDLNERALNAGAPDLGVGSSLPPTTAAPTTTAPVDPGTTAPSSTAVQATLSATGTKVGSDWIATVVITVTDTSGQRLSGLSVTGAWSSGVTGGTSCVTGASGSCSVSSAEIDRRGHSAVPSVTLTISSISGSGATYASGSASATVAAP